MEWLRRKSAMERRWGIESHVLGANELRDLAPAMAETMVGADFVPAEGYGDPLRGTHGGAEAGATPRCTRVARSGGAGDRARWRRVAGVRRARARSPPGAW